MFFYFFKIFLKMSLKEKIEDFINEKFNYFENQPFEINFAFYNKFPIIYDNTCYIYSIIENKIDLSNKKDKILKIKILKSHFDILMFKHENNSIPIIKFLFICLIEKLIIKEEKENNNYNNYLNLYKYSFITNNLKKYIFSYIKEKIYEKENKIFPHWLITPETIQKKTILKCKFLLENILLGNNNNNNKMIKFINTKSENMNLYNINDYINNINEIYSPIEIEPLKINNQIFNDENKFQEIFMNDLEIEVVKDNNDYDNNLFESKEKILEELPEKIKKVIEKFKGFKFTKKIFEDYYFREFNDNKNENQINEINGENQFLGKKKKFKINYYK